MASTKTPGNPPRRQPRDGGAPDSERADCECDGRRGFRRDETPEEAARAIADALNFLEQETAKLGVHGARELIQRAAVMMRDFATAGHE